MIGILQTRPHQTGAHENICAFLEPSRTNINRISMTFMEIGLRARGIAPSRPGRKGFEKTHRLCHVADNARAVLGQFEAIPKISFGR